MTRRTIADGLRDDGYNLAALHACNWLASMGHHDLARDLDAALPGSDAPWSAGVVSPPASSERKANSLISDMAIGPTDAKVDWGRPAFASAGSGSVSDSEDEERLPTFLEDLQQKTDELKVAAYGRARYHISRWLDSIGRRDLSMLVDDLFEPERRPGIVDKKWEDLPGFLPEDLFSGRLIPEKQAQESKNTLTEEECEVAASAISWAHSKHWCADIDAYTKHDLNALARKIGSGAQPPDPPLFPLVTFEEVLAEAAHRVDEMGNQERHYQAYVQSLAEGIAVVSRWTDPQDGEEKSDAATSLMYLEITWRDVAALATGFGKNVLDDPVSSELVELQGKRS